MLPRRKLRLTYFGVRMQQKRRRARHTATVENVTVTLTDVVIGEYFISRLPIELRQLWGIALFHQNLPTQRTHPRQFGTDVRRTLLPCSALLLNGSHHVPVRISFPRTLRSKRARLSCRSCGDAFQSARRLFYSHSRTRSTKHHGERRRAQRAK